MIDVSELRRKAKKRKIVKWGNCDATTGWHPDPVDGIPLIEMCHKPGKWYPELSVMGAILCDEHFNMYLEKIENS